MPPSPHRVTSPRSQRVHDAAMQATFRPPRRPTHDPYAITAPIDPHSAGDGWGEEDTLRGQVTRGVEEED